MCAPVRTGLLSVDVYMLLLAETKLINSADQRAISGFCLGVVRELSGPVAILAIGRVHEDSHGP